MGDTGQFSIENGIGIIMIDSPPVNALGHAVRQALAAGFDGFAADDAVRAIVVLCAGRTFFAGADITEFGKPFAQPDFDALFSRIDASAKPVVAALHGTALGGGFELALACHYRVAVASARVGLPEVHLGLLPGAGGTQRLPRIVGADSALDLMTSGRAIPAAQAHALGLIDAIVAEGELRAGAIAFAQDLVAAGKPLVCARDREDKLAADRQRPDLFDTFRQKNARAFRGFRAPESIVCAVEAAVTLPFEEGLARERTLFEALMASTESAAQRHMFFAEREASKIPDIPKSVPTLPIASVGVIGAGTMGGGIAMCFLNIGIPVTLVELRQEALDRGIAVIRRNYEGSAKKGRMTAEQVEQRMALLTPALSLDALARADLVIEAVFESMAVKQDIFGTLDRLCKPGAILASNTSFLDLNTIAAATTRPEWVVGMHFFSPANVMRLLEVVRGAHTAADVVATAMELGRRIGKVSVLAGVCHGFIANRLMEPYMKRGDLLAMAGPSPAEIDKALFDYGFAMGPFQMVDLVGLDVIGRDNAERTLSGDLVALGRLGQKSGGGFYDYDENRRAVPSPVAAQVIAELGRAKDIAPAGPLTADAIVARLLYPVVNAGARILEEGIALRASDIDVAAILGYNWPVYTGGPMFWADTIGLETLVEGLRTMGIEPAPLLVRTAQAGGRLSAL
ncbi:3-hydroxyacyl-CoA dehydrogenase NAD-binding domain-containing protein [Sphingomonas sp. 37zxx]|uniref:3-hydroxyacyl-CoA dehydrogenase NAD-binding domain-containing protein n=1 Tax=Sphingomonas sp. 37zxx TaxID=1550073 RepID=UPI00053BDB26|nr:3-hydroxyacyl-CoA dehydrogenase NAD-binding domain-containing protein [Sphingomonas sp. 37zxx]